MKFINNINKYSYNSNLIDNMAVFAKLNNGIEYYNIDKYWYINEKLHRENDKPAIEYPSKNKEWFINGKFIKQNWDSNGRIYNDKFFDRNGNKIKN